MRYQVMPPLVVLAGGTVLVFAIRPRMLRLSQQTNATLLIVNMIGTCVYVWLASYGWFYPEEPGINFTGEPFVWAAGILPVVALFLPLNIGWGVVILGTRQWKAGPYLLLVATMWLIALVVDFAHH